MFEEIVGNEKSISFLKNDLESGALSHAYVFCGPKNVGKFTLAKLFSARIMGNENFKQGFNDHPDIFLIEGEEKIKIESIRNVQSFLGVKPYYANKKVVLIKDIERMTKESANCLLKTLEEPQGSSLIILSTTDKKNIPETIMSRCRIINFGLTGRKKMQRLDIDNDLELVLSSGRPGFVKILSGDNDLRQEISNFKDRLSDLSEGGKYKERLDLAREISESKNLFYILDFLTLWFRNMVLSEGIALKSDATKKIEKIIIMISKLRSILNTGVNTKLFLEVIMLNMEI